MMFCPATICTIGKQIFEHGKYVPDTRFRRVRWPTGKGTQDPGKWIRLGNDRYKTTTGGSEHQAQERGQRLSEIRCSITVCGSVDQTTFCPQRTCNL